MPTLKIKFELNIRSAKLLIDNELYTPSVHCAYYSSFQLLKHVVVLNEGTTYELLEIELRDMNHNSGKHIGVHEFLINKKLSQLLKREKGDYRLVHKFNDIKTARIKADYKNIIIDHGNSEKIYKKSLEVIETLKGYI